MLIESEPKNRVEEQVRLHPSRIGWRPLARRGFVVPLAMLAVTAVAWAVSTTQHPTYRAESIVQVPSGAGPAGPGDAGNARALATTYASLIADDEGVGRLAARAADVNYPQVFDDISVVNAKDTAVLSLRFVADSPAKAIAGARALQEAVTTPTPRARGVAPGSLQLVRPPTGVVDATSVKPEATIVVGLVLGLVLGIVLMIAWERADPRVDDAVTLRSELSCPALELDGLSRGSLAIVLERWLRPSSDGNTRVALVPTDRKLESSTVKVAERLAEAGSEQEFSVDVSLGETGDERLSIANSGNDDDTNTTLTLVPARTLGGPGGGERIANDCDVVVLIVRAGQSVSAVRRARELLHQLDLLPQWAIVMRRGWRSRVV